MKSTGNEDQEAWSESGVLDVASEHRDVGTGHRAAAVGEDNQEAGGDPGGGGEKLILKSLQLELR